MTVRAKLNRLGLELVGDISWPEHVSIFTTPFNVARQLGIPLIFYGENPQNQYGGPMGTEDALEMTRRWRAEFGGFLGLRPMDMVGQLGITDQDMEDYEIGWVAGDAIEARFLGAYIPWDSHRNAQVAAAAGMEFDKPSVANWWEHENLDNAQTGLHDYFMFRKYGYGRGCAQISVDVRAGLLTRATALDWVERWDGTFPYHYAGVHYYDVLDRIGISVKDLWQIVDQFACSPTASSR